MFDLRLENSSGNIVNINDEIRYEILSVSGLNPPVASVFSSKSPNRKGRKKNGSTLDYRPIVIQIKLLGDIEKNRNDLYAWTDTETELKIYYSNSTKSVFCEGTVTECDIDLFTDNEVINLAIECDDPYLKDIQEIITEISALQRQFTFPFAIGANSTHAVSLKTAKTEITEETTDIYASATEETTVTAGIPFSTQRGSNTTSVFNAGAETGVKIKINCTGDVKNLLIFDPTDTTRQFKINYTFSVGYVIEIDTESSPKTVKAIPPTETTAINILKYVEGNPTWFTLKKGNNLFAYTAESGAENIEMTIGFRNKYLGV